MSVYSTTAAEQIKESQMIKDFKFTDLLEFVVNSEVNNQRIFNAMIELDFQEAVNNMNGSYLTESGNEAAENKKQSIIQKMFEKILAALTRFGEILTGVLGKIISVFKDVTDVNKQILSKFGDLNAARLALINKEAYKDLTFDKYIGPKDYKFFGSMQDIKEVISRFDTSIYATKTKSSDGSYTDENLVAKTNECVENLKKFGADVKDNALADPAFLFKKVSFEEYIKDTDYIVDVNKNFKDGYKNILKVYSDEIKSAKDANKERISKVSKEKKESVKAGESDRTIAILNARLVVYNTANSLYAKLLRTAIVAAQNIIKYDRAAYAKLGNLVLKAENAIKKGQEVQHNSAMLECYRIDLLNEECINAIFE